MRRWDVNTSSGGNGQPEFGLKFVKKKALHDGKNALSCGCVVRQMDYHLGRLRASKLRTWRMTCPDAVHEVREVRPDAEGFDRSRGNFSREIPRGVSCQSEQCSLGNGRLPGPNLADKTQANATNRRLETA